MAMKLADFICAFFFKLYLYFIWTSASPFLGHHLSKEHIYIIIILQSQITITQYDHPQPTVSPMNNIFDRKNWFDTNCYVKVKLHYKNNVWLILVTFVKACSKLVQSLSLTSDLNLLTVSIKGKCWDESKKGFSDCLDRPWFFHGTSLWCVFLQALPVVSRLQVMLFLSVAWQQKGKNRWGDEWRWARGR